jgi:hypothetical protein
MNIVNFISIKHLLVAATDSGWLYGWPLAPKKDKTLLITPQLLSPCFSCELADRLLGLDESKNKVIA